MASGLVAIAFKAVIVVLIKITSSLEVIVLFLSKSYKLKINSDFPLRSAYDNNAKPQINS